MLPEAELFSRHGYGILTLDTRPCLGLISTLGALESRDLAPMLNFAATQPGVNRVAGLGFSVGAVSLLMGAPQQPQLRSLIAEGNFPNLYSEFTAVPAPLFSFTWQVQRASAASYWLLTGIPPWMVSPLDALASLKDRQVLLIHGEKEAWRTKPEMQLAASGSGARLWVVPGADHGEYYQAAPLEYERRVIEFLEQSR